MNRLLSEVPIHGQIRSKASIVRLQILSRVDLALYRNKFPSIDGPGCVKTVLPKLLSQFGGEKALIITGKSLREKV
jgi:hypothetical protein